MCLKDFGRSFISKLSKGTSDYHPFCCCLDFPHSSHTLMQPNVKQRFIHHLLTWMLIKFKHISEAMWKQMNCLGKKRDLVRAETHSKGSGDPHDISFWHISLGFLPKDRPSRKAHSLLMLFVSDVRPQCCQRACLSPARRAKKLPLSSRLLVPS